MTIRTTGFLPQAEFSGEQPGIDAGAAALPMEDLTAAAREGRLRPAVEVGCGRPGAGGEGIYETMARALYRRTKPHLLLTGERGTGRTSLVRELARRAAAGGIPFLKERRLIRIDVTAVPPEESRWALEAILAQCCGRRELLLCLDGLGSLLVRPRGEDNRPRLRAALAAGQVQMIGILSTWEFHDLLAGDAVLGELCTRVEVPEPTDEETLQIALQLRPGLEAEYRLSVQEPLVRRAVQLSSSWLLNERRPARAVRVLRQACEDVDYHRTQRGRPRREVRAADLEQVVAETAGIPVETLRGEAGESDFAAALEQAVVGQDEVVRAVADELELIRAGLTEPNKPASVLLLAGMTGVGKTELARRLAELYSTSKRPQVYSMGNYTEPHSVSGILGVPPGYVGHEQGGRLVNELNADPYTVFLLDEAEKAHPNVWKPFLNLFDDGWLEDPRGVRAWADRAIFVLTTNAGDSTIAQMHRQGKPEAEIAERVRQILAKVRQERSSQPVFPPQFLSRIRRLLVFRPLDEAAMAGIAERMVARMSRLWQQKREREIVVGAELTQAIGRLAHEQNETAGGREGGRIVRKLIAELVELPMQRAAVAEPEQYRHSHRLHVSLNSPPPRSATSPPTVSPDSCGERSGLPVRVGFEGSGSR